MKVVFFGSSSYVTSILEVLNKDFELAYVFTTEKAKNEPVTAFSIKNKIPYSTISSKDELEKEVRTKELGKGNLGAVADFGVIIPKTVLDNFTFGILNIHPSLLPTFRGPTPVQSALIEGNKSTGVTIIKLDEHMDHGPILFAQAEPISPDDTSENLYQILFKKAAEILPAIINKYINREIEPIEQDHSKATFTKFLTKTQGFVDIAAFPKFEELDLMIKAYFPWPGVWTQVMMNDKLLRIKFLPHKKIQVEGKKEMSYKDFLNGYPDANAHLRLILQQNV